MDGLKKTLKNSIQRRLSAWLAATILIAATAAGLFSFSAAFNEAHELQDDLLRQIASLVDRQERPAGDEDTYRGKDTDEELEVTVQDLNDQSASNRTLPFPPSLNDGMQTVDIGGEPFRVFVRTTKSGRRLAAAQETEVRDTIARDSALRTVMPFLLLLPLLLFLVTYIVRTMIRPITDLADELDRRGEQDLRPVAGRQVPVEMQPFITAFNRLLDRIKRAMDAQRSFVANAAHELRSPMTVLSLQAERMKDLEMSDAAHARLTDLQRGIERGRSLLNQLLALARVQLGSQGPHTWVSVEQLYRAVLEDLMPLAEGKNIDVGIEEIGDIYVYTDAADLASIVRNLVDNALRYTPTGGRVDLSAAKDRYLIKLNVKDSGPGIPEAERERVFEPFYRILGSDEIGSGLGLSIVKAVAERTGLKLDLTYADKDRRSGLSVTVSIPVTQP